MAKTSIDDLTLRIAALGKCLVREQAESDRATAARAALPAGSSRARVTTANARWARKAEQRDRTTEELRLAHVERAALMTRGFPLTPLRAGTTAGPTPIDALHFVSVDSVGICEGCLSGMGGECHSPGCLFWLMDAPDLDLRDRLEMHGARFAERADFTSPLTACVRMVEALRGRHAQICDCDACDAMRVGESAIKAAGGGK